MTNAASIIARVRSLGANLILDGDQVRIVNGHKLPAQAMSFIRKHGKDIGDALDREAEFDERAAIVEFDGGLPRHEAEGFSRLLLASPPDGVDLADWTWFVGHAATIMDGRAA